MAAKILNLADAEFIKYFVERSEEAKNKKNIKNALRYWVNSGVDLHARTSPQSTFFGKIGKAFSSKTVEEVLAYKNQINSIKHLQQVNFYQVPASEQTLLHFWKHTHNEYNQKFGFTTNDFIFCCDGGRSYYFFFW